ncbi:MAG: membrane fusion protein (multidrug efflux system) [Lentisphaeria bacterium]|jgi:membrane fusion protein (multidrug efflux system)
MLKNVQMSRLVVIALLVKIILSLPSAFAQQSSRPTPVFVKTVKLETFVDRVEAIGTLGAFETTDLTSIASEVVSAINFEDGHRVEQGQVIVEMTSAEEQALLVEANAEVEEAQQQLERVRSLVKQRVASQSLYDERYREYSTAKARLVAIESRLSDRIIRAPYAGVLGLRNISLGELVRPGDVITTLNDDSRMKLDFSVPELYLATLKRGIPVQAKSRAFPGRDFTGEVVSVDNQIDPITRSIKVRAILPNQDRVLVQGLLMNVVLLKNAREALVIPEEALLPQARLNFVYVVVSGGGDTFTVEKRRVETGKRRPGAIEILEGLQKGERIVVHGADKIRPGQTISIRMVDGDSDHPGDTSRSRSQNNMHLQEMLKQPSSGAS